MTTKQARVIKGVVENGGIDGQLLARAGYSEAIQHNPYKVINSPTIQNALKQYLPHEDLFKAHREALKANKHVLLEDGNMVNEPDHAIRLRAATEGYKVHGIGQGNNVSTSNTQINITLGNDGYIPPNNTQQLKPTLKLK